MNDFWSLVLFLLFTAVMVGSYFLPAFIAMVRKMPNVGGIVVINLLLGWTGIGWVIALVMACVQVSRPATVVVQQDWRSRQS